MKTYREIVTRMAEIADIDGQERISDEQQDQLYAILFGTATVFAGLEAIIKTSTNPSPDTVIAQCQLLKEEMDEMIHFLSTDNII